MKEKLPKNICQVGQIKRDKKIFIEEYVISYLQEIMKNTDELQMVVFYGDGYECDGARYYFLKGAASHRASGNKLKKMDEFYFQTIGKQYFSDLKGIGWYCLRGGEKEIIEILQGICEQDFHDIYGYYIYFEKNEGMEEYMLHRQQSNKSGANAIRRRPEKTQIPVPKKPAASGDKRPAPMMAVQVLNMISLFILIVCCIIAVTTLNQYDKMKQLEETVTYLETSMEEQKNLPEE